LKQEKIGTKPVQNTKPRILIDVEDQNVKFFVLSVSLSHRALLKDSRQLFLSCFHVSALTLLAAVGSWQLGTENLRGFVPKQHVDHSNFSLPKLLKSITSSRRPCPAV
jgi:hypothetical protein